MEKMETKKRKLVLLKEIIKVIKIVPKNEIINSKYSSIKCNNNNLKGREPKQKKQIQVRT